MLAPSATASPEELPVREQLAPVENAACGTLDGDFEYGCRMIFWGFYVFEQQMVCSVVGEYVPLHYIWQEGPGRACWMPEEPLRHVGA